MPGERQQPGEVGLLAELAPALERVDHVLQCYARRPGAGAAPGRAPAFLSRMRFPTRAALAALLAALVLCLLGASTAGAGALQPRGEKIFFGISDTGDSADFGAFSTLLNKHPALIESFRTWGSDFPESIERWQDGAGATGPPHHDRRQQRRPRADHPAGDRPGPRRRVPGPPQQAVLGEEDARLHPPARRAQPLHQRLRLLRLLRQRRATRPTGPAGTNAPSAASTSSSTAAASGRRSTPS